MTKIARLTPLHGGQARDFRKNVREERESVRVAESVVGINERPEWNASKLLRPKPHRFGYNSLFQIQQPHPRTHR
jgi:hypothetical protein